MTAHYDVAVVGGGPAGAVAATEAAGAGLRTVVFEEHSAIGVPCHCTGKLAAAAFKEFRVPSSVAVNEVNGAHFYSPDCQSFAVRKSSVEAYIVNRALFDRVMMERAADAGAELRTSTRVLSVSNAEGGVRKITARNRNTTTEAIARVVIDAEGSSRRLAMALGSTFSGTYVRGIQRDVSGCEVEDERCVEVYLTREFAPGFFAWIVPLRSGMARVGLCVNPRMSPHSPRVSLARLIKQHPVISRKLRNAKLQTFFAGMIPLHGPAQTTYGPGFMVIGDAAAQTKSTSGGGIYFGMKAGRIAARMAVEALERNDTSATSLKRFERLCAEGFGRELRFTSRIRRFLDRLGDKEVNALLALLRSDDDLRKTLEQHGDTAYQSKVWNPLLLKLAKASFTKPQRLSLLARTVAMGLLDLTK